MKYFVKLFILITVISSCNNSNTYKEDGPEPFLEANDEFVLNTLGYKPTAETLNNRIQGIKVEKIKTVKNKHIQGQTDTLFAFITPHKNTFTVYSSKDKDIFRNAQITNDEITLKHGIKVGMSKESLNQKLKIDTIANIIRICDTEQMINWTFYFKDSFLYKIAYEACIDKKKNDSPTRCICHGYDSWS